MGKHMKFNKIISYTLILALILTLTGCKSKQVKVNNIEQRVETSIQETTQFLEKEMNDAIDLAPEGYWIIMTLARSGENVDQKIFEDYYNNLVKVLNENNGVLHERKYTVYSRTILALTAMGKDPTDVGGYNLLEAMADYEKVIFQGINGPTFALIALDSNNYEIPNNPNANIQGTREMYIDHILEHQLNDGGFEFSARSPEDSADPDMTAMILQALSKYQDIPKVKEATEKALNCLSNIQLDNGGYHSWGSENSESVVQVIMALTELGIDPEDERFVKEGNTLIENLLTFYVEGGGFMHVREGEENNGGGMAGKLDPIATEQGYYGLVAYRRFKNNQNSFYDMTDANNEK